MAIVTPFVQVGTYPTRKFRYLRTVIVTAAVYWDFNQELAPHHLIFQHPGRRHTLYVDFSSLQSAVFLVNSRSHRFSAASLGSPSKWFTY